ncbi:MAG: hypothetical protein KDB27_23135 [Planctomycetales bacterium]|nr:hypothetical protein [Planctomycetales bacterium]
MQLGTTNEPNNSTYSLKSTFAEGDWNNDGEPDSSNIVFAFQSEMYVSG